MTRALVVLLACACASAARGPRPTPAAAPGPVDASPPAERAAPADDLEAALARAQLELTLADGFTRIPAPAWAPLPAALVVRGNGLEIHYFVIAGDDDAVFETLGEAMPRVCARMGPPHDAPAEILETFGADLGQQFLCGLAEDNPAGRARGTVFVFHRTDVATLVALLLYDDANATTPVDLERALRTLRFQAR